MFDDPTHQVRDAAFSVAPSSKGFLLREDKWAYIQYGEDASQGIELFDMAATRSNTPTSPPSPSSPPSWSAFRPSSPRNCALCGTMISRASDARTTLLDEMAVRDNDAKRPEDSIDENTPVVSHAAALHLV